MPDESVVASLVMEPVYDTLPAIVRLVGPSGSGKTTLAEKLIPLLTARGLRIGAIKRSHHDVETDTPGKDSHRLREAGAVVTALASDRLVTLFERPAEPPTIASLLPAFAGKADIVIVESFGHDGTLPDGSLDVKIDAAGFDRDDAEGIADRIVAHCTP